MAKRYRKTEIRAPTVDADNPEVVVVSLTKGKTALMNADDWERLKREHTPNLFSRMNEHGRCYPSIRTRTGNAVVARLLVGARRGERILYRNADSCDLRRDNLSLA